jgi:hypothetical protein
MDRECISSVGFLVLLTDIIYQSIVLQVHAWRTCKEKYLPCAKISTVADICRKSLRKVQWNIGI